MHSDVQALIERVEELERGRRRHRILLAAAAVAALCGVVVAPSATEAARGRASLLVSSPDGSQTATLTPEGLTFAVDGQTRLSLDVGLDWSSIQTYAPGGTVTYSVASQPGGTELKLFSRDGVALVEANEQLLDGGAGLQLYGRDGRPRVTLYADRKRDSASGLQITDGSHQERASLHATDHGAAVLRVMDSGATAAGELSVVPIKDAMMRYTGMRMGDGPEGMVPMLFLLDPNGTQEMIIAVPPI